ncbi:S8 family serine peptidase [Amylibacter sp.]|nr:S8 family serine peptidase [Amylibacter sp.]
MYFYLKQLFQNIIFLTHSRRPPDAISQKVSSFLLILLLPFSLFMTGCGGGGTTTATETYRNTIEGAYGTEYNNQVGLAQINAVSLNNYGHNGSGVKVAVVDSGIASTHAEFGRAIYGRDFGGSTNGYGSDEHGHGTHVASIIAGDRDGSGMRGVAYEATLYDYRVANDAGSLAGLSNDTETAKVFNQHVIDNIKVSNNSWGTAGVEINEVSETWVRTNSKQSISAALAAINNGTLFVFAAGNNGAMHANLVGGLPYRIAELNESWLVVVSVDPNNVETYYTNRCGVAAAFCVTAPGGGDSQSTTGIYAADNDGGYIRYSGTSMAAPHVTGLAAALMSKFPSLTNKQIATRIKTTSSLNNLTSSTGRTLASHGEAYMQSVFGHGLVNATAASASIGSLNIGTGSNIFSGSKIDLSKSKMQLPSGLSAGIKQAILADGFVAFDSFDGAEFIVKGNTVFEDKYNNQNIVLLGYFADARDENVQIGQKFSFTNTSLGELRGMNWNISQGNSEVSLAQTNYWGEKASLIARPNFFTSSPTSQLNMKIPYSETHSLSAFIQAPDMQGDIRDRTGFGLALDWAPTDRSSLHSSISSIDTNVSLAATNNLASQMTNTDILNLSFKHKVNKGFEIFGSLSHYGIGDIAASPTAFGISNAEYTSTTLGAEFVSESGSKYSIGVFDSATMAKGSVAFQTATGRSTDGTISYQTKEYSNGSGYFNTDNMALFFAGSIPINYKGSKNSIFSYNYQSIPGNSLGRGQIGVQISHVF